MCYMAVRARQVGVRELRQNLSIHLDRVKAGQTLTVTEHGHAVAELRPLPRADDPVARLRSSGQIAPAKRPVSALPRPLALNLEASLSALLDDLREDTV
jgi:antitoxin (DNA-binding transcriptional repressor) of toxin-antitoxin stability system